VEVLHQRI